MIKELNKKLVLAIRKWLRIENVEHRHWCNYRRDGEYIPQDQRCYHSSICWYCVDPFCADVERKDCPNCVAGKPHMCTGKSGVAGKVCTCGYGRG